MSLSSTQSKLSSNCSELSRHICVCDGPDWGDAKFVSLWLSAVLAADTKIERYLVDHPRFRSRISRLEMEHSIELKAAAMFLLGRWLDPRNQVTNWCWDIVFHIDIEKDWCADLFAIMANVGFLELTGEYYKMSIPKKLDMVSVRRTLVGLAETEDDNFWIYPGRLLHTMNWSNAERCKLSLRQNKRKAARMESSTIFAELIRK